MLAVWILALRFIAQAVSFGELRLNPVIIGRDPHRCCAVGIEAQ